MFMVVNWEITDAIAVVVSSLRSYIVELDETINHVTAFV